jgi:hypothetical protein
MSGLAMTDEDRQREIAAYVRELAQTEARLAGMPEGADGRGDVEQTLADIREQLRIRGHEGTAPHQRAAKRVQRAEESR